MIAAGRAPDVEGLGLEEAGIALTDNGLIAVDGAMRTSLAGVYAIGDLVPAPRSRTRPPTRGSSPPRTPPGWRPTRSSTSTSRARRSASRTSRASGSPSSRRATPATTSSSARCGFGAVGAGTVYGDRSGLVKIVGDRTYGELLGGHIVGTKATELIQELVNVRALEGGFGEVARIVHGHPTLSEAVMEAARDADGWIIHG